MIKTTSEMHYPRLRHLSEEGLVVASEAILICFYMQHPHQRIAKAVVRAIDLFMEQIRPHRFNWYIDPEGDTYLLDDSRWERIRDEMLGPGNVALPRLASAQQVGEFSMDYRGLAIPLSWPQRRHAVSALYLSLPTSLLEEHGPAWIRTLALDMAQELPFNSGYVDFALCDAHALKPETLVTLGLRYPGLHLSDGPDVDMGTWVEGVHWMNFLGEPVLGQLGGVTGLRERLSLPGLSVQEMSGERVLITLGERPDPGDTESGRTLPLHRALASLLEPHLHHREFPLAFMRPEDFLRWERRFLDG